VPQQEWNINIRVRARVCLPFHLPYHANQQHGFAELRADAETQKNPWDFWQVPWIFFLRSVLVASPLCDLTLPSQRSTLLPSMPDPLPNSEIKDYSWWKTIGSEIDRLLPSSEITSKITVCLVWMTFLMKTEKRFGLSFQILMMIYHHDDDWWKTISDWFSLMMINHHQCWSILWKKQVLQTCWDFQLTWNSELNWNQAIQHRPPLCWLFILGNSGVWDRDYGWEVRVRRPFGARGMSSVRYGTRLGDLKENWFLLFSN